MERLEKRLESVQEGIYEHIEERSDRLSDQIKFWELLRKEQALLFLARKHGIKQIGMEVVPPMKVSEQKAKEAIEVSLLLQSLNKSPYKDEPWTMQNTSRERLLADPQFCFKKDGRTVDIVFDGRKENSVRDTLWGWIYYQDSDGKWQKQPGEVDNKGLFYRDYDNLKRYYVDFKQLAERYSAEGRYQVYVDNKIIADIQFSLGDSAKQSRTLPQAARIRRGPTPRGRPTSVDSAAPSTSRARSRSRSRSRTRRGAPSPGPAPSARQVGSSHVSVTGPSGTRLQRLLREARDPPAVILTGPPNTLKCLRYRLRNRYDRYFRDITTSWKWTHGSGSGSGVSSMLVSFDNDSQRNKFVDSVPVPTSVTLSAANLFLRS